MVKKPTSKKNEYQDFILGMRDQINRRVNSAIGRFPNYRIEAVRAGFEQCFMNLFEANVQNPQQNFGEIFDSLLNLFLLAVGQNYYAGSETPIRHPYLDPLFNTVFPKSLPLLGASPNAIPAMLFNTCEYVEERAGKFLDAFIRILSFIDPGNFEKMIQLLLWLLGDPRRRQSALTTLIGMPETTRTEILDQLLGISCDSQHILDAIGAMMQDPWIHPSKYFESCEKKLSPQVSGEEQPEKSIKCRLRYGSFTGFQGIYDGPPKIAGFQNDYLITYTPMGKLFFSMLDGIGSWAKSVLIPPCRKVIFPTEDCCFGITLTGKLMNLRTGEEINLLNVQECIDLYADTHFLHVVVKAKKSMDSILKFHIEWGKNETNPTKKGTKILTEPISSVQMSSQPYCLSTDPTRPDTLLFEAYKKETMDFQLIRVTVDGNSNITNSTILYEQKEPYLFSVEGKACHIVHADGSYARYNPECTKTDLTMKFHGLTRPTSLFLIENDVFATSSHSFHVFGFLNRPPESGVPAEIDLISRG